MTKQNFVLCLLTYYRMNSFHQFLKRCCCCSRSLGFVRHGEKGWKSYLKVFALKMCTWSTKPYDARENLGIKLVVEIFFD